MNKKISLALLAIVVLDIVSGDFSDFTVLKAIKWSLYIICFILILINGKKGELK